MRSRAGSTGELRSSVLDDLVSDALVHESQINVPSRASTDHVTIRGTVQTEAEKRTVIGAVSYAPGVSGVVCDELRVDPG